jgi:hypothetical protein
MTHVTEEDGPSHPHPSRHRADANFTPPPKDMAHAKSLHARLEEMRAARGVDAKSWAEEASQRSTDFSTER